MNILQALDCKCDAPEFRLINEIIEKNHLRIVDDSPIISNVKDDAQMKQKSDAAKRRKVQVMFNISRFRSVA